MKVFKREENNFTSFPLLSLFWTESKVIYSEQKYYSEHSFASSPVFNLNPGELLTMQMKNRSFKRGQYRTHKKKRTFYGDYREDLKYIFLFQIWSKNQSMEQRRGTYQHLQNQCWSGSPWRISVRCRWSGWCFLSQHRWKVFYKSIWKQEFLLGDSRITLLAARCFLFLFVSDTIQKKTNGLV